MVDISRLVWRELSVTGELKTLPFLHPPFSPMASGVRVSQASDVAFAITSRSDVVALFLCLSKETCNNRHRVARSRLRTVQQLHVSLCRQQ